MAISLKTYTILSTTVTGVLAIAAFTRATAKPRFAEIDVERINIVEADGRVRMTISNAERSPGWVFRGTAVPGRPKQAGMIFYNDEGEENGGLIFGGKKVGGKAESFGHLSFDQYDEDQDLTLDYQEEAGMRKAGIGFFDRPDTPIMELIDKQKAIAAQPDGPVKDSAMQALRAGYANRLFVGRDKQKTAIVQLSDASNRPRLRLTVDSAGAAAVEFLDESGKVTRRLSGQ
ncbi:MAG TPA: hypothetical protein VNW46_02070 [Gemmatimonadaceae bacterium]|jgi:hypothetical protein|nr:hypothetical protein [Gemmatimonadaceae bacterium]